MNRPPYLRWVLSKDVCRIALGGKGGVSREKLLSSVGIDTLTYVKTLNVSAWRWFR